jgi:large subunit ribosomal protein L29
MLKASELLGQTEEELKSLLEELSKQIFQLRNKLRLERKLDQPHLLKEKRRDKARVLSALTNRESSRSQGSQA